MEIDFNFDWEFWKDGQNTTVMVDLPHDAMIHELRDPGCDNAHNSGFYPGGKYYYHKAWAAPADCGDKKLILWFEGVYQNAEVHVNGSLLIQHPNGYLPFMVDCGSVIRSGETNEILVVVDNSMGPNARWYSGSGIYRPVHLIIKDETYIQPQGVRIETVSLEPARVRVSVQHQGGTPRIEIFEGSQKIAAAEGDDIELMIPDAKLWSAETPYLYRCRIQLMDGGIVRDEEWVDFGIRTLAWSTKGFFVNGEETKLRGACVHHDNGILGACAFADAEERKIRTLKDAGFNAIRSSHNPCSEALLKAADRYGMYVMDEFSDVWFKPKQKNDYAQYFDQWCEKDLTAMVTRDYNHPSVIMYSIGNEIGEVWEARGVEITKRMTELCHQLDTTRPVTCGTNLMLAVMSKRGIGVFQATDSSDKKNKKAKKKKRIVGSEFYNLLINAMGQRMDNESRKSNCDKATSAHFAQLDICGYNYATIRYADEPKLHPERIIVGSETRPPNIVENWRAVMGNAHVIGDFMWTGWDYLGEAGIGAMSYASRSAGGLLLKKYPYLLAGCGVIDLCGQMRPEIWLNRAAWGIIGDNPYIGVEPVSLSREKPVRSMWRKSDAIHNWTWHGFEGFPANVVVYSNATTVELLLNGSSISRKKVIDHLARFKMKYWPGELTAVNLDANGDEIGRDVLRTAEQATKLTLQSDRKTITADGQSLCFIDILITDQSGEVVPSRELMLNITVEGAGTLQGFGSANPYTDENFVSTTHETYFGRAMAVVRASRRQGDIRVTVFSKEFGTEKLSIRAMDEKKEIKMGRIIEESPTKVVEVR